MQWSEALIRWIISPPYRTPALLCTTRLLNHVFLFSSPLHAVSNEVWQRSYSAWRGPTSGVAGREGGFVPPPRAAESRGRQNEYFIFKKESSSALPNCYITKPNLSCVMWKEERSGLPGNPMNPDRRGGNSVVKVT